MRFLSLFILLWCLCGNAYAKANIIVLGDSISEGYGINPAEGWVSLLKKKLHDEDYTHDVINASVSGYATNNGVARLPELLNQYHPKIVIIELGGNDGLRGIPIETIRNNLAKMITTAKDQKARIILVGMKIPPNYGQDYTLAFDTMFLELSSNYKLPLIHFFLEGVYDHPGMMQSDGIHPTTKAQPILLNNIWPVLLSCLSGN